jgi:predicted dehydrogenase
VKAFRAALIGCGNMGSLYSGQALKPGVYSHAHAYASHPDTELVAVCDTDGRNLEACASQWKVPGAFRDHQTMLKEATPDIVSICTPDQTHYSITLDTLEAASVRGILVEKPLALTLSDARTLVESGANRNIPVLINYSRRFDPAYEDLRQIIRGSSLGTIQTVTGYYGKGLWNNGTHWLDLAQFLFGAVLWVSAEPTQWSFGGETALNMRLGMDSGFTAHLTGTDAEAFSIFEMDIVGVLGRIRLVQGGSRIEHYSVEPSETVAGYKELANEPHTVTLALDNTVLGAVSNLVSHLQGNSKLACPASDAAGTVGVAQAAVESAAIGERVWLNA